MKKEESRALQGMAVLIMIFHHFFLDRYVFPEGFLSHPDLTEHLARTGRICVAIFSFVSGYGIYHVLKKSDTIRKDFGLMIKRIFYLYVRLWIVIAVCVVLLNGILKIPTDWKALPLNMTAMEPTYNGTWWYVRQYLWMLLSAPFIKMVLQGDKRRRIIAALSAAVVLTILILLHKVQAWNIYYEWIRSHVQAIFNLIFFEGYLAAYLQDTKKESFAGKKVPAIIPVIIMLAAVVIRYLTSIEAGESRQDILIVPIFIWGMVYVFRNLGFIEKFFGFFGKYSLYMWLMHAYIWFLTLIWITGYQSPLLYFAVNLGLSFAAAFILVNLEKLFVFVKSLCYNPILQSRKKDSGD